MDQSQGAASASAGAMDGTKSSMGAAADTKLLEDTAREGMSLIDRFYNGGNRARPAALDILVVVLDGVVRRMRQSYATRQTNINEGNEKIKRLDQSIASIKLRQGPLQAELDKKKARAAELKAAVTKGEQVILDSVAIAKAATTKAGLLQRHIENDYIAGEKLCAPLPLFFLSHAHPLTHASPSHPPLSANKGYDGRGRALPGREVNLRKKDKIGARKPGDMANADDTIMLERVEAVMAGNKGVKR